MPDVARQRSSSGVAEFSNPMQSAAIGAALFCARGIWFIDC